MKSQLIQRCMTENTENPYNREESFQKLYMVYQLTMSNQDITPVYQETLY